MIQNQHDKVFKGVFSKPEHAADLLRTSLPQALLEHLDMASLRLSPGSFVDDTMRERFTDLLYRVTLAGREAFVYLLLEHKSTADALTAFFMARYVIDLNEEWNMTIVMIEHDMGVVMDISHRVMVLDFGKRIALGTPEEVRGNPHVKRAYLGEEDEVLAEAARAADAARAAS